MVFNPADVGARGDARATEWPDDYSNEALYSIAKQAVQEARILEKHFHTQEVWCGISADQSGDAWALPQGLNPFVAATGNGIFGAVIKVMGIDDSPLFIGNTRFDMHRILFVDYENVTPWIVRFIWGMGTAVDAEAADQWTEIMVMPSDVGPPIRPHGVPVDIKLPRLIAGEDKLWCRVKNATNLDEIDFFIGIHEYDDPV